MADTWSEILDAVLRPARPALAACLRAREEHLVVRKAVVDARANAVAACVRAIESARAAVFASDDGVVTRRMTELEREWRRLSRPDPDGGLMDLWARIAPRSWLDRKPWRDSAPEDRLDVAVALAADSENAEVAEAAIERLRVALAANGAVLGPRVRWCAGAVEGAGGGELVATLLAAPLAVARLACAERPVPERAWILEGAERIQRAVHDDALARFPARPGLARDLAHAAYVDHLWHASGCDAATNPVTALRALWKTGYVLSAEDAESVTVEVPALAPLTPLT